MTRKIIVAILAFSMSAVCVDAQELNLWMNDGEQGLSNKISSAQGKLLPGGSFGLGYTFPLGSNWGLTTGVSGGLYGAQVTLSDGVYTFNQVDNTGSAFQYIIKTTDYKETQHFVSFAVPLLLQFHTAGPRTRWYINGGGKLLMPLNATIKASAQELDLSGYYPDFNVKLSDLPNHGFGTINNWEGVSTYKLKTGAALSAETGLSFALSSHARLYTGLYVEYGLTDLRGSSSISPLVSYSATSLTGVQASSVLNTQSGASAKLLSYGIQIKIGFGHTSSGSSDQSGSKEASSKPVPFPDMVQQNQQNRSMPEMPKRTSKDKPLEPNFGQPLTRSAPPNLNYDDIRVIQAPVVFDNPEKTTLSESEKSHLDSVADIMKRYPSLHLSAIGRSYSAGTDKENSRIALARARAVVKYLRSKGIDPERMGSHSIGSDELIPDVNANKSAVTVYLFLF